MPFSHPADVAYISSVFALLNLRPLDLPPFLPHSFAVSSENYSGRSLRCFLYLFIYVYCSAH